MRIAIESGRCVAKTFVGQLLVPVTSLANGEITARALLAFATENREGNNDPVANFDLFYVGSNFHDLAHEFIAHDVAMFHARHESIVEMQVRPSRNCLPGRWPRDDLRLSDRVRDYHSEYPASHASKELSFPVSISTT